MDGQPSPELPGLQLETLCSELGFSETLNMKRIVAEYVESVAISDNDTARTKMDEYWADGQMVVDEAEATDRDRVLVGLSIANAIMLRDAGNIDEMFYALNRAADLAANTGQFDELDRIDAIIDQLRIVTNTTVN